MDIKTNLEQVSANLSEVVENLQKPNKGNQDLENQVNKIVTPLLDQLASDTSRPNQLVNEVNEKLCTIHKLSTEAQKAQIQSVCDRFSTCVRQNQPVAPQSSEVIAKLTHLCSSPTSTNAPLIQSNAETLIEQLCSSPTRPTATAMQAIARLNSEVIAMNTEKMWPEKAQELQECIADCSQSLGLQQPAMPTTTPISPLSPNFSPSPSTTMPKPVETRPLSARPNSAMWRATRIARQDTEEEKGLPPETLLRNAQNQLRELNQKLNQIEHTVSIEFVETEKLSEEWAGAFLDTATENPDTVCIQEIARIEDENQNNPKQVVAELKKLQNENPRITEALRQKITHWEQYANPEVRQKLRAEISNLERKIQQFTAAKEHLPSWDTIKITNYLDECPEERRPDPAKTATVNSNALVAKMKAKELHQVQLRGSEKSKEFNHILGHLTKETQAGRCFAVAAMVATDLVLDPNTTAHIEVAGTKEFNHAFVIVGRQNYDPNKPDKGVNEIEKWGPDAFVIDVWQANQKTGFQDHALIYDPQSWYYGTESVKADKSLVSTQIWKAEERESDRKKARTVIETFNKDRAG